MRQYRWLELVKDYDFDIKYHSNKANLVINAFSRKVYLSYISTQKELQMEFDREQTEWVEGILAKLEIKLTLLEEVQAKQTSDEW